MNAPEPIAAEQAHRLLLVEDNTVFAEQIGHAIEKLPHKWSTHQLCNGMDCLSLLEQGDTHFDLALVDIGLPDISGIEVIKALNRQLPELPVVVISVMAAEKVVLRAIEAGARGYILKGESVQEITKGITQIMDGHYPLSPSLARYLFNKLAIEVSKASSTQNSEFKLTNRELQTLQCLSQGLTYEEVSIRMGVTISTIQWNIRNLYRKLNVRSQVQAVAKAIEHKLI